MIEVKLPTFVGGVSRQPETQRQIGTVHDLLNGLTTLSSGLEKRSGLAFERIMSNLSNPDEDYIIHWIDTTSKTFVAFITNHAGESTVADREPIQVFDIADGSKKTINFAFESPDYEFTRYADAATAETAYNTYLTRDDAGSADLDVSQLKVFSIFDSTFIVNKDKTCSLTGTADNSTDNKPHYNGVYGSAGNGDWGLTTNTRTYASYVDFPYRYATSTGSTVAGTPTAGAVYRALESSVGYPAGFYQAANPIPAAADDNLYTQLVTDYDDSLIDYSTMPLQLKYNESSDDFTLQHPEWRHRFNGDSLTNPGPSFIGRKIDDMVFHKNRLWISADEFIIASVRNDFFNFWPNDVLTVSGSDPIDEAISDEGLNKVIYSVSFNQALILFTEGGRQFEIRSVGPMAPDSVSIIPTTSYFASDSLRPIFLGNNLYFLSDFDNSGQIYEYFYIENAANNVANSVTDHIPEYLPSDFTVASKDVNNGILLFSDGSGLDVYPYITRWNGDQKLQNSFSKWTFTDAGYTIKSHFQTGSQFYFIMQKVVNGGDDEWILCSMDPVDKNKIDDIPYKESLDFLMLSDSSDAVTSATYDSSTGQTTITLTVDLEATKTTGSTNENGDNLRVIPTETAEVSGFEVDIESIETTGGVTVIVCDGDWSDTSADTVAIGFVFPFEVQLNKIYPLDRNGLPESGTLTMRKFIAYLEDSYFYTLEINTPGRSNAFSQSYSVVSWDTDDIQWDSVPMPGSKRSQSIIYGLGHRSRITIKDTSAFPLNIVGAEVRGNFNKNLNPR